jgi:branched-chain amino acid transport system permease protein
MTMLMQILVDGFVVGALYGLGAIGFTMIFGVSGVLNLAHGGIMIVAAFAAWLIMGELDGGMILGIAGGLVAAVIMAYATYYLVVRPIDRSRRIANDEKEIFVLAATLLWGIMIQEIMAYLFTAKPISVPPLIRGVVSVLGVRTPSNEIVVGVVAWIAISGLWLFINRTQLGKSLLAASMNPRALTLLGTDLAVVYRWIWGIYGVLAGIGGVLLATFVGASSGSTSELTASAFIIVVIGGLGSVPGSLLAGYVVGVVETVTAYTISPSLRTLPALFLMIAVLYLRPQGLLGRR